MVTKASPSKHAPADPFGAARKHLARAAALLESFARGLPLVFTKRCDQDLRWVTVVGPNAPVFPRPDEVLQRFYAGMLAVQDAMQAAGCRGPGGVGIRENFVMEWMNWSHIQSPANASMGQLLTLAQALGKWWATNRRHGSEAGLGFFVAIDDDSVAFARAAAAEATALASLLGTDDPSDADALRVAQLEVSTPPLNTEDGSWIEASLAAKLDQVTTGTLATYRNRGMKNRDGSLGRDPDGRVWRNRGRPRSPVWYFKSTLVSKRSIN